MPHLSKKEIHLFAQKILDDYDSKNPGTVFKSHVNISNTDALLIQQAVSKLREKRGEEIIGYKIGCVLNETQRKMGFTEPACGSIWKNELHSNGVSLSKKNYSNPAMEAEFGIILNRDIKPEFVTYDYILNSIEAIFPLIEIHISNIFNRESFREKSFFSDIAVGIISGFGEKGYKAALDLALEKF